MSNHDTLYTFVANALLFLEKQEETLNSIKEILEWAKTGTVQNTEFLDELNYAKSRLKKDAKPYNNMLEFIHGFVFEE